MWSVIYMQEECMEFIYLAKYSAYTIKSMICVIISCYWCLVVLFLHYPLPDTQIILLCTLDWYAEYNCAAFGFNSILCKWVTIGYEDLCSHRKRLV